jgi:hypothetical protein
VGAGHWALGRKQEAGRRAEAEGGDAHMIDCTWSTEIHHSQGARGDVGMPKQKKKPKLLTGLLRSEALSESEALFCVLGWCF